MEHPVTPLAAPDDQGGTATPALPSVGATAGQVDSSRGTTPPRKIWSKKLLISAGLAVILVVGTVVALSGSGLDRRDSPYIPDAASLIGRNADDVLQEFSELRAGAERDGHTSIGEPSRVRGLGYTYEFGLFEISDEVWTDGAGEVYEVIQKTTVPESTGGDRKAQAAQFYNDLLSDWTGVFGPPSFTSDSPLERYGEQGARSVSWAVGPGLVRCISYGGLSSPTVLTKTTTRPGPSGC